jgi:DinB superfamily
VTTFGTDGTDSTAPGGPTRVAVELLQHSWLDSAARLERRCAGLTDDELLWEPVRGAWNLVPDSTHGGWSYPYDFAPPEPHPVTTIGWRLVHLTADNLIYLEYAFGPGSKSFPDLPVRGTAAEVMDDWRASTEPITAWLGSATDADLLVERPSHLGGTRTAGEVLRILLDEQTHHGAEVALLRDLFAHGMQAG